jgi:hypothetical protein
MSSKNPSQLREPPPGFEPGMDGYNIHISPSTSSGQCNHTSWRRGDHEVHDGHVVALENNKLHHSFTYLIWTYLTCLPCEDGIYDVCGTKVRLWGGEMFSGSAPTGWDNMHWYVMKVVSKLWRPCWSWCPSCRAWNKNQAPSYKVTKKSLCTWWLQYR